ncbi:hypothetical protein BASA81_001462 [Batrachochytrium salamandrivorans]|nr:hypothetical protein BASA81_001462 [Batrachochytrium salamandrivorans]
MRSLISSSVVNACLCVPCLFGYASIIFSPPVFHPFLPLLTKLVILSSAVHQMVFSLVSPMWFAIGQVQDAGLVFLSHMCVVIAQSVNSAEEAVSTAVVLLGLSTALLGAVVTLVAKLRLSHWVSYIPTPVVAGYLGFIGFFCLAAGLGLACDQEVLTVWDFGQLLTNLQPKQATQIVPTLALGGAMYVASNPTWAPWYALPAVLAGFPIGFYWVLVASGSSMQDARDWGWMDQVNPQDSLPVDQIFTLVRWDLVQWSVVPLLIPTWLSMCFVVTFASALDIIALDMAADPNEPKLDVDDELVTVGYSNLVSGLLGGYTGSYIFSVTAFTKKTGLNTKRLGASLAGFELALFVLPVSLPSYLPRFLFAATLVFIALDLCMEWLFGIAFKMSGREYGMVWLTFLTITFANNNLVLGIALGTFVSFAWDYYAHRRFTAQESALVEGNVVRLNGYLTASTLRAAFSSLKQALVANSNNSHHAELLDENLESAKLLQPERTSSGNRLLQTGGDHSALIVDFANVGGMDTTQAATGLARLQRLAKAAGALLIFSGMSQQVLSGLEQHGVLGQAGRRRGGGAEYAEDEDEEKADGEDGDYGEGVMVCKDLPSAQLVAKQRRALHAVVALSRLRLMVRRKQLQEQKLEV